MGFFKPPRYARIEVDKALEKHIRCNCGKYWGMRYFNTKCKRCKSSIKARGLIK